MTYSKTDDTITLTMNTEEWAHLLLMVGHAAGVAMRDGNKDDFYRWIQLANEMNRTNPEFITYSMPEKFQGPIQ